MKLSRPFGLANGNRPPFLDSARAAGCPEWNPVTVQWCGEKPNKKGNMMLLVIYRDVNNAWIVSQRYFPEDSGLTKALSIWGIKGGIEDTDMLTGREINIKLEVNGAYVNVIDYQASDNQQQVVDDVPF